MQAVINIFAGKNENRSKGVNGNLDLSPTTLSARNSGWFTPKDSHTPFRLQQDVFHEGCQNRAELCGWK